ncbi:nitrate ABC transporter ATP-binding protein [Carbonactinospora thermoautotrophica]|uniref:ABC transporter ATP-binding protein n=1 Tax=Carbonactinospora thermoautotrophica TaxID=1469144 RepID=UPI00226EA599|nr:ABC transporter ATP-binding protein [Carbonactinospora thermoautotrophica]MCX9190051.1 nitrate ABC transporter ATP-binding protein [Carbonactinospora thermoautotrophica]
MVSAVPGVAGFRLERVTIGFGSTSVIEDLDLDVRPGEILTVVGPSGCGKSTLLRVLAGLQPVASGRILFGGEPVAGPSAQRALVFQDDALLPWRTALRNVELPLAIQGVPRARRREQAAHLLGLVGLSGYERHRPAQLSGGMRQRVQLARALVQAPRAILMDEPFGALDAQNRAAMQRLLLQVWRHRPTTVVFVTHDVDEALLLGDRVAVLTPGPGRLRAVIDVPGPRDPRQDRSRDRERLLTLLGGPAPAAQEAAQESEVVP